MSIKEPCRIGRSPFLRRPQNSKRFLRQTTVTTVYVTYTQTENRRGRQKEECQITSLNTKRERSFTRKGILVPGIHYFPGWVIRLCQRKRRKGGSQNTVPGIYCYRVSHGSLTGKRSLCRTGSISSCVPLTFLPPTRVMCQPFRNRVRWPTSKTNQGTSSDGGQCSSDGDLTTSSGNRLSSRQFTVWVSDEGLCGRWFTVEGWFQSLKWFRGDRCRGFLFSIQSTVVVTSLRNPLGHPGCTHFSTHLLIDLKTRMNKKKG